MAHELTDFRDEFPEFAPVADATVTRRLNRAAAYLDVDTWGDCFDDAVLYYAAHNLALQQLRAATADSESGNTVIVGGAGAITSASVDGVSTSYATPKNANSGTDEESWLYQTPYGQHYLQLRDNCISGGRIAGTRINTTFI